jgi:hypothetical protein
MRQTSDELRDLLGRFDVADLRAYNPAMAEVNAEHVFKASPSLT